MDALQKREGAESDEGVRSGSVARGSSGSGGTCSRSRGTFSPLRYDVIASRRERSALAFAFIRVSDVVTEPMITEHSLRQVGQTTPGASVM